MVYASRAREGDTGGLVRALLDRGVRLVVPIIERETVSLRLSYLNDPAVLVPSTFGVPEPIENEHPADSAGIETMVLPPPGFDRADNRLGYGTGYYDRFLCARPVGLTSGVALACQELHSIPADPLDVPLDRVVTEYGPIRCREDRQVFPFQPDRNAASAGRTASRADEVWEIFIFIESLTLGKSH